MEGDARVLSAFSDAAKEETPLLATVLADGQLKVWDTASNDVVGSRPANLSDPVTAIVWERWQAVADPTAQRRKKRAKKADQPSTSTARLLLGSAGGKVMVFSHASAATVELKGKHGGMVSGCVWGKDSSTAFTCSADRYIYKWSLDDKKVAKKFKSETDEPITAISYCGNLQPSGVEAIFYAASQITILDVTNGTTLKQIIGHAGGVGAVQLTPTNHVLSASLGQSDDTLMYAWSTDLKDGGKKAASTFGVGGTIVAVDVAQIGADWRVLAVTADGTVEVFQYDKAAGKAKKKKPSARVGSIAFTTGDVPSETIPVFAASFARNRGATHIVTARGSAVVPVLEEVLYVEEDGETPTELSLVRDSTAGNLLEISQLGGPSPGGQLKGTAAERAAATIVGASSVVARKGGDEATIAEQVKTLGLTTHSVNGEANTGAPTAGSLVHMLAQALHSNDKALLEECLGNTNEAVVRNTVSRLPPPLAVKFLTVVVSKLQARPNRGIMLMVWVRAVLMVHTSYLMTVPDLPQILEGMYNLVDARLAVFPRLLKLSGRLDLLLSQVLLKSEGVSDKDEDGLQVPVVIYDDEDSDSDSDGDDAGRLADSGDDADEWDLADDDDVDDEDDEDDEDEDDEA